MNLALALISVALLFLAIVAGIKGRSLLALKIWPVLAVALMLDLAVIAKVLA